MAIVVEDEFFEKSICVLHQFLSVVTNLVAKIIDLINISNVTKGIISLQLRFKIWRVLGRSELFDHALHLRNYMDT